MARWVSWFPDYTARNNYCKFVAIRVIFAKYVGAFGTVEKHLETTWPEFNPDSTGYFRGAPG